METSAILVSLKIAYDLSDKVASWADMKRNVEGKRIRLIQATQTLPASNGGEKYRSEIIEGTIEDVDENLGGLVLTDVEEYVERTLVRQFPEGTERNQLRTIRVRERDHKIVSEWESAEPVDDE